MSVDRIIWNKLGVSRKESSPMKGTVGATRNTLAEIFNESGYKLGAEIGVERGIYSEVLCQNVLGLKLICVDPWRAYNGRSQRKMNIFYNNAVTRLQPYNVEFKRMTSMDACLQVPDGSLDFVYIDGLHDFDSAMMDIIFWEPKVKINGIVSGHDYIDSPGTKLGRFGVIDAVLVFVKTHRIQNWYLTSDNVPSWFWVKRV